MTRLLLDQGLPSSTVELLRAGGWDVVHVCECGLSAASDREILEFARTNRRTVCTLDADFHALLAVSAARGPSVVRIRREGLRGPDVAALLQKIWGDVADVVEGGAMVSITERTVRVRKLPVMGESTEEAKR